MSTQVKFTGTLKAWSTSKWPGIDDVVHMLAEGNDTKAANVLTYTNNDMSEYEDWTELGIAEVTVTLHPRDVVVGKALEGLQAQLQAVRAENHMRESAILERISKLQAIEYSGDKQ